MTNKVFSVSFDKEMNLATSEMENQVYLRVYKSMFTSGLVAQMKLQNFATLMAIASYMNEDGECFPTQAQLAERMGVHVNSVNKYVNQLLEFEVNGKPIITREIVKQGRGRVSSFYKIHPISQLAIFDGSVESITKDVKDESQDLVSTTHKKQDVSKVTKQESVKNKRMTAKDLLTLFMEKYRQTYNVNYNPSWGRDVGLMKKLSNSYTDEQIVKIFDITFAEYGSKWKSAKFPRPTIGAITSFIAQQALAIIEEHEEQDKQFAEYESKSEELDAQTEDKLSKLDSL